MKKINLLYLVALATVCNVWTADNNVQNFISAVKENNIDGVKQMLKQGIDPNEKGERGLTALHWAIHNGSEEMTKLLLENEADPNIADRYKVRPLWRAAKLKNNPVIVKLLLEHGADPNVGQENEDRPFLVELVVNKFKDEDNAEIIRLLLKHNANPNVIQKKNLETTRRISHSPLYWAAIRKDNKLVELLLSHGAKLMSAGEQKPSVLEAIQSEQGPMTKRAINK
ncbi:MAG: ankyrin repeat domain-containing protein [Candidatus Dependentiae bacterium]